MILVILLGRTNSQHDGINFSRSLWNKEITRNILILPAILFSTVKNVTPLQGIGVSAEYDNNRQNPFSPAKRTPQLTRIIRGPGPW